MTTKSDRNVSVAEFQAMWPGIVPSIGESFTTTTKEHYTITSGTSSLPTEAVKNDKGRSDWTLLPFESLEEVVKVLDFGAKKYDKWNWTVSGGFEWTRVARAALNHTFKWLRGEDNDDESGLSHIAHAICNLILLLHYIKNKDKYPKDNRVAR